MPEAEPGDRAQRRLGSLTVYCGPTHSGKTRKLEAEAERARRQGRAVQRFASAATAGLLPPDVIRVRDVAELKTAVSHESELITIDGGQGFDGGLVLAAEELATAARMDVVVAGWELDFQAQPAGPLPELMARADVVLKLGDGVCAQPGCRNLASRTQRFVDEGDHGFLPVCRRHHDPDHPGALQERWFGETAGVLEVIAGCMFSGKTLELIRRLDQERYAGASVQVFKPALDDRYDAADVASHRDLRFPATPVADTARLQAVLDPDAGVIGVDEVQFLDPEIVTLAEAWASAGRHVILAGLDLDFLGRPFGPMPALLALSDRLTKLQASCQFSGCGSRQATRTQRIIDGRPSGPGDPLVLIAGAGAYQARCRHHHEIGRGAALLAER